ncbi:hypothetical protein SAMN04487870_1689 [Pseudoalteromonas sp. DSM 26666]|nr:MULTISPECIES: hypothetical protein [unclassified Pseudoalteromonas]KGJ99562.1 hypothetical protein ND6B_2850 [Pseudoalteromonas sp. ND6B]SFT78069.1 hypothetical protein SAMN04487870_1689 [Pseudoalteromonas sp. DSM 26666]
MSELFKGSHYFDQPFLNFTANAKRFSDISDEEIFSFKTIIFY